MLSNHGPFYVYNWPLSKLEVFIRDVCFVYIIYVITQAIFDRAPYPICGVFLNIRLPKAPKSKYSVPHYPASAAALVSLNYVDIALCLP